MGYKTINERGADKARLLHWLIQPKQGVRKELAELGIQTLELELAKGEEPHKTCDQFKKFYEKIAGNPRFPESFWIDNYVLFWCRDTEKRLVNNGVGEILNELELKEVDKYKSVILLTILNALIVFNLVSLWIL